MKQPPLERGVGSICSGIAQRQSKKKGWGMHTGDLADHRPWVKGGKGMGRRWKKGRILGQITGHPESLNANGQ